MSRNSATAGVSREPDFALYWSVPMTMGNKNPRAVIADNLTGIELPNEWVIHLDYGNKITIMVGLSGRNKELLL